LFAVEVMQHDGVSEAGSAKHAVLPP